ncbi:hypothetical protein R3P38DRAFT_2565367, partial [Favolaschia claudopus]
LINFEVLIWLPGIPRKPVGRSKSKRVVQVDPASFGPVLCTTNMTYADFMEAIAETLHTTPEFLVISSAEWKHLRPANAPWFPLRDQSGYQSLHRKIITPPKGVSAHDIIVRMNTPMQAPAKQTMPWAAPPSAAGPSHGPGAYAAAHAPAADKHEISDDDSQPQKKVPFDEALEDEVENLKNKYPPGLCSDHPDLRCFHHQRSRNHFELDRPKLLVWAAMIVRLHLYDIHDSLD